MFPVVIVPEQTHGETLESLGTKPKFWFEDQNAIASLFKEIRPDTGEDWSEKIASELCKLLGLPHVHYELAVWRGKRGVVSRNFVPAGGQLVHGNELLAGVNPTYPSQQFFRVRQHTLESVLLVLEDPQVQVPIGWNSCPGVESALDVFIGYLMLDAWIANQDRHHENWGLVVSPELTKHLAPSYDHASSLGRNETDATRAERLTTRDQGRSMETYVERARSAFFSSPPSKKPLSTLAAFWEAGKTRPAAARVWLDRLQHVSCSDVQSLFEHIPSDRMTPAAREFALKMLTLNRRRLLVLYEEFA